MSSFKDFLLLILVGGLIAALNVVLTGTTEDIGKATYVYACEEASVKVAGTTPPAKPAYEQHPELAYLYFQVTKDYWCPVATGEEYLVGDLQVDVVRVEGNTITYSPCGGPNMAATRADFCASAIPAKFGWGRYRKEVSTARKDWDKKYAKREGDPARPYAFCNDAPVLPHGNMTALQVHHSMQRTVDLNRYYPK